MKKFFKFKTFTLLIVLGILFAFAGMAIAKEKGAVMQSKNTADIIVVKTEHPIGGTTLVAKHIDPGQAVLAVDTSAEVTPRYCADRADSSCIIIVDTGKSEGGAAYAATFVPSTKKIIV